MHCLLCESSAERVMTLRHTEVWRCRSPSCDLQFAWPQPDEKRLSQAYEELYYPRTSPETSSERLAPTTSFVLRQLFESLRQHHPFLSGQHVLDYGCGSGVLATVAREYGMVTTGIEPDPNARAEVRLAGISPVYAGIDQLLADRPDAQFDWILLWNVIEHLRSPWSEMRNLRRLCAPGGFLVAATPNANCVRARLMRQRWEERVNSTHLYYFTPTSLTATFRAGGFRPIFNNHRFVIYPHHGPLRRLVQRALVAARLDGKLEFWGTPDEPCAALPAVPPPLAKVV